MTRRKKPPLKTKKFFLHAADIIARDCAFFRHIVVTQIKLFIFMINHQNETDNDHPDDHLSSEEDGYDNESVDQPEWKSGIQRSNNGFIAIIILILVLILALLRAIY